MIQSCYQNILESASVTLSVGSQNNSYPLYRLYDRDIGRMFEASAAASLTVHVDQGSSPVAVDRLFIPAGHNLSGVQLDLQGSDDDVTYATVLPNLLLHSQDFENAWWSKNNSTVIANSATAPDGTLTASIVGDGTAYGEHELTSGGTSISAGQSYTASVYFKYVSQRYVVFRLSLGTSGVYGTVDILNGLFSTPPQSYAGAPANISGSITSVGNGWFRASITVTADVSGTAALLLISSPSGADGAGPSYTGNNNTYYVWGAQAEAASAASLYIPTNGTAQQFVPGGSGLIEFNFPSATHRYWKLIITNPAAAPQFAELFLTSTYTWEKLPARPGGPFDDVFNVKTDVTASGLDRFLTFGNSKRQRIYKVVNAGATQQTNILALNTAWAGSKPFWLYDHEGNWIYGKLNKPLGLKETGAGKYEFDFNFLEVLGS
ncbi:MAG: hypothetical protein M0Z61_07635 [Nitrospiraceae bacterium]|nr:hypothetical protein [Nitrospiraceae bacterium]